MYENNWRPSKDSYYAADMVKRSVPRYGQRTAERGGASNWCHGDSWYNDNSWNDNNWCHDDSWYNDNSWNDNNK